MNRFEDKLLNDLMVEHGAELADAERPPARRGISRPVWVTAGVLAVAATAAAGITVFGDTPPAYAVTRNDDGSVTVTIRELAAIEPANAKLRELGVRVRAVPQTTDCPTLAPSRFHRGSSYPVPELTGADTVTIAPAIPEGYTVLLSMADDQDGGVLLGSLPVRDPAPSCVLDSSIDPATRAGNGPAPRTSDEPVVRPSN